MRYAMFRNADGPRAAIVRRDEVHPFAASAGSLEAIVALPRAAREALVTEAPQKLADVTLLAPLRPRKNVFAVGLNYTGHADEIARAAGKPPRYPKVPTFFTKAATSLADPEATLHLSADVSPEYDWEAELAIVIGERCRDVPLERAHAVVFGYTALNDVTARDLQRDHGQWFKGKSLDETCPLGPWLVDAAEIGDPQTLDVTLRLNGEVKQHASTSTMIFNVAQIVASLSRGMTLEPGDVIATGTPHGVGFARTPPEFLRDGDVMEVEISKIGVLRNPVAIRP
ncbi:MAG: fumarylacetoacetate hydrolase family protein [Candidatus Eremiobacteraeota bacterium]|nr:fumarylacetoacetate hydrolase family protein [Candidatus Eremiobacteraeota bacterium]